MRKNRILKLLTMLASLVMLLSSTVGATLGFIVTKSLPVVNTFTPFETVVSNLLISKSVEHPLGDTYVIPDHISFDFQLSFGSLYANSTVETSAGKVVADENGVITLAVKPGQTLAVKNIDVGTRVTVTELQREDSGFTAKDNVLTQEAVISENGSVEVSFTNVYEPKPVQPLNVTVNGAKRLVGREWQYGDQFSFVLEQKREDGSWALLGTKTVTYDGSADFDRFDFSSIIQNMEFKDVGTYTFRVTEQGGDLEYVTYDGSIAVFALHVTDTDMDGKLEINTVTGIQNAKVTEENGSYNVSVSFSNVYIPPEAPKPDDIQVTVTANKTVKNTGDLFMEPDNFTIQLENTDTGELLSARTDEQGVATFDLTFTADDVGKNFTYRMFELDEGADGVTYDAKIYTVTVKIRLSEDNKLVAQCLVDGFEMETPAADFINVYHKMQPASPPTGDSFPYVIWFVVLAVSGVACAVLVILGIRHRKRKEQDA